MVTWLIEVYIAKFLFKNYWFDSTANNESMSIFLIKDIIYYFIYLIIGLIN